MRFTKLVYVRYMPLTSKIFNDLYMDEAIKAGIMVEYWDISKLFFQQAFGMEDSSFLLTSTRKFKS